MKRLTSPTLLLLLSLLGSAVAVDAWSAETILLTKLRVAKIDLLDGPEGNKLGELTKEQFVAGSWIVTGGTQKGFLPVRSEGKSYWVKTFSVATDKPVAASAECGVMLAANEKKIGGIRSLGEECKK